MTAYLTNPIPPARVDDLRRVWSFLAAHRKPGMGVDVRVLAQMCEEGADVAAVFFRATLINLLLDSGRLDPWRERTSLRESVYEVAARFPLPAGLQNADFDAFIATLNRAESGPSEPQRSR